MVQSAYRYRLIVPVDLIIKTTRYEVEPDFQSVAYFEAFYLADPSAAAIAEELGAAYIVDAFTHHFIAGNVRTHDGVQSSIVIESHKHSGPSGDRTAPMSGGMSNDCAECQAVWKSLPVVTP